VIFEEFEARQKLKPFLLVEAQAPALDLKLPGLQLQAAQLDKRVVSAKHRVPLGRGEPPVLDGRDHFLDLGP
jgi:hypothetical protein